MAIEVLIAINVLFLIFLFLVAYVSLRYFINQIEKYPRVTFEEVYDSKKLRQKYNIETPAFLHIHIQNKK